MNIVRRHKSRPPGHVVRLASLRERAGVTDPTWSPPALVLGPPVDAVHDALSRPYVDTVRRDVTGCCLVLSGSSEEISVELGDWWQLAWRASIVAPRDYNLVSIALLDSSWPSDRYTLEAGTVLRLSKVYEAIEDPSATDLAIYGQFFKGWSSWTFEVETGESSGIVIEVPSDFGRFSRYPFETQRAALALQPV